MAEKLAVLERTDFGKGASRRVRAEGRVPAVLYGHGMDSVHLTLPGHETALLARNTNALIELVLPDGTSHVAMIKDIQRHPLKRNLTHLDLIAVRRGEKVEVDIPVLLNGEPVSPNIAVVEAQTITVSVDAMNVPEQFEVDVTDKEAGFQVFAGDIVLPEGAELVTDAEILVLGVVEPHMEEELPEEGEESASEDSASDSDSEGSDDQE